MIKPKKINIANTNMANFGTALEKNVKRAAAECEAAWDGVGQEVGMHIWRIEKFKVVAWPKEKYGEFLSGDSYILLRTTKQSKDSEKLSHDIHFWLGSETTQDEAGTAAYKTVELDDKLHGAARQHREVCGNESQLFMSYFDNSRITILEGGVDSGFRHVEGKEERIAKQRARLLHVKGARKTGVVVMQVPLARASLNSGDCFLLDAGKRLVAWIGTGASAEEKQKCAALSRALRDERGGSQSATTVILDQGSNDKPQQDASDLSQDEINKLDDASFFWYLLDGGYGDVADAEKGGDDASAATSLAHRTLYRLCDKTSPQPSEEKTKADASAAAAEAAASSGTTTPENEESDDKLKAYKEPLPPFDESNDGKADAELLRDALSKFIGKDNETILRVVSQRSRAQLQRIRKSYSVSFKRDLIADMSSKATKTASFGLMRILKALTLDFEEYVIDMLDGYLNASAVSKTATGGSLLHSQGRVLLCHIFAYFEDEALLKLAKEYEEKFKHSGKRKVFKDDCLSHVSALKGLRSKDFGKLLEALFQHKRQASPSTVGDSAEQSVRDEGAQKDAKALYDAGEGKRLGTDEKVFIDIFSKRSWVQLARIAYHYEHSVEDNLKRKKKGKEPRSLEEAIHKETSGFFQKCLLFLLAVAQTKEHQVKTGNPQAVSRSLLEVVCAQLYDSMKGVGTRDDVLVFTVVMHREWMAELKPVFFEMYGKTLTDWIKGDTSGSYRKLLLVLVGDDDPKHHAVAIEASKKAIAAAASSSTSSSSSSSSSTGVDLADFDFTLVADSAKGGIKLSQLVSDDVMIFDSGVEVFCWVGKGASRKERRMGLYFAQLYLQHASKAPDTPIVRVLEGGENAVFREYFDDA